MRQRLVAGNWKMHGTRDGVKALIGELKAGIDSVKTAQVAVCPPYVFLPEVRDMLQGSAIALGAQDVC
ncbi:MAG TPA: triose-phosphate isomerase, partial [Pseudodesulfovibrio sp.]|nr:triose-phosphate isomerase [Pseudodesulfovibrio sp.]